MQNKRTLITAVVVALLGILIYSQFREWRDFEWDMFWAQIGKIDKIHILYGVALIYLHYGLRALRWKIFLKPLKKTSWVGLMPPTLIGFTGLALLGRPGEFIRPYLIARQAKVSFSSQIAVWTVERIFDLGAFAVLIALAIFLPSALQSIPHPEYYRQFRDAGFLLIAGVAGAAVGAVIVSKSGESIATWIESRFSHLPSGFGHRLAQKVREFGMGLNTIHGPMSLLLLAVLSIGIWYVTGLAYQEVTHSYGVDALEIPVSQLLILMGASMAGSMLQLPAVGGGSQMATIATLSSVFDVPPEMAASCGILLWLVTFAAVVPLGLALAHPERLLLRTLSAESQQAEEKAISD